MVVRQRNGLPTSEEPLVSPPWGSHAHPVTKCSTTRLNCNEYGCNEVVIAIAIDDCSRSNGSGDCNLFSGTRDNEAVVHGRWMNPCTLHDLRLKMANDVIEVPWLESNVIVTSDINNSSTGTTCVHAT